MRVLFWYCDEIAWTPAMKTLEEAPEAEARALTKKVVVFVHVEPQDTEEGSSAETKLVKNTKWLARKWETKEVVLHSFTHLGMDKAEPGQAKEIMDRASERLESAGYDAQQTPYGYFLDLKLRAPGHPLARIYKEF